MDIKYDKGSGKPDEYGTKRWYLNGKLHREDGPACEWSDGDKEWWLNGKFHRTDGPACEYEDGSRMWCVNGELHREDGPAIEWANGTKEWYLNDKQPINIFNQEIIVGKSIEIKEDIGIVLKNISEDIYLVLLGNQKVFIVKKE